MKQYSFLMESINNSNIDLIKKNFKYCINTYKQVYNFDLSYIIKSKKSDGCLSGVLSYVSET